MSTQNELLEALKDLQRQYADTPDVFLDWSKASAAIAKAEAERVEPVAFPFKHNGVKIVHKGHAAGLLNHLAKWMRREDVGDYQSLELVAAYVDALEATPPAVSEAERVTWNKSIRDRVDVLLAQAGYAPDSSVRNALSCMNFDTAAVSEPVAWLRAETTRPEYFGLGVCPANDPNGFPVYRIAPAAVPKCQHRIADARNPLVKSGYICIDCGSLFSAADHEAERVEPVPPNDEEVFDDWVSASDSDGISYDGLSFERGYKLGQIATLDDTELAAPEQEHVATVYSFNDLGGTFDWASPPNYRPPVGAKLYTAPPAVSEFWQPIETAPEGTMILCANMKASEARNWAYVAWVVGDKAYGANKVEMPTHWMPLPPAPSGVNK